MEAKKFTQVLLLLLLITMVNLNLSCQTWAYGNYTGNGTSKAITGLGFSPKAIIIKSQGAYEAVFTTKNMAAGKTKQLGTTSVALITGEVTSLDADGFTIGSGNRTNNNTTQYQWIAFNESTNIHVGTYVGDGSPTAEVVTGFGFSNAAEAILVCGDAASAAADAGFLLNSMGAGSDDGFFTCNTSTTATADYVVSYAADGSGWTTGTGASSPILSGVNYYYIAFNVAANSIKDATYTAVAGTSDFAVTGLGAAATFVAIWRRNQSPVFTTAGSAANKTHYYTATTSAASRIKSLDADGFTAAANNNLTNEAWQVHNYFAMTAGTALPVQMTSFEAEKKGENVVLKWQTASEVNSDYFEIMHSVDGENFESVGKVHAAGNTHEWKDYSFIDEHPSEGIHYYQLMEYDADGKFEKFKTLAVNVNNAMNAITQLFPNPSSNHVTLYYNSSTGGAYKINITDLSGNTLYFAHIPSMIGENKFKMTLEPYAEGTYFINLSDPSGGVSSVKAIKKQ